MRALILVAAAALALSACENKDREVEIPDTNDVDVNSIDNTNDPGRNDAERDAHDPERDDNDPATKTP